MHGLVVWFDLHLAEGVTTTSGRPYRMLLLGIVLQSLPCQQQMMLPSRVSLPCGPHPGFHCPVARIFSATAAMTWRNR